MGIQMDHPWSAENNQRELKDGKNPGLKRLFKGFHVRFHQSYKTYLPVNRFFIQFLRRCASSMPNWLQTKAYKPTVAPMGRKRRNTPEKKFTFQEKERREWRSSHPPPTAKIPAIPIFKTY